MLERRVKPDNVTFSTIISCARVSYLPLNAVEWFEKMPKFGCEPDAMTYSTMIDAYGRAGNGDMALSLYDRARIEEWCIDLVTFSTLIKIYGVSGNFDGALNVYEEMKALGVKPNLVTYNTLLDVMGRAKRPWQAKARYGEDAMNVYKEMKEKGLELNVVLYNTLLAMCADIGYIDEVVQIFKELKKSETCKPDAWTFSSLITIYSCSGKVSEAENMLNEMLETVFEPNIYVLTSIIQCYGKVNQTDDVMRVFDRHQDLGITPDDQFCGCLLNVMRQTPKEELGKLIGCIESVNPKLGSPVKHLVEEESNNEVLRKEAGLLFDVISKDVRKAYWNCLIDLCVNLDFFEGACVLLDMGLTLEIYTAIQSKSPTHWSLHLKNLSLGAALTVLHKVLPTKMFQDVVPSQQVSRGSHKVVGYTGCFAFQKKLVVDAKMIEKELLP
ncbi:hypothetical protein GIB67_026338 [Kingdonia uniflora]|uniref:PROP1-like PPR domain-containing protein n=1 Tax=Kingdonia uniflora TaxID=39325 RepID=A0A7J7P678_9MAGN|nr:hypothetical protein GIB67_026338 [Kingdonia uniflora]